LTPEHKALVDALNALHLEAGLPSLRSIAENTKGLVSHTTVSYMLTGKRLPRWKPIAAVVHSLGGDRQVFSDLWEAAWLGRPDKRAIEAQLGLELAANLDVLLRVIAETGPENLELIAHCRRCRNRLLYLMRPGSPDMGGRVTRRLRVLNMDHEDHGAASSFDDAVPKLT
jgi:hypothetical protein